MSNDNPGANPNEAHNRGGDGVTVAETFAGLITAFETAAEELDAKAAEENIEGAFEQFYIDHKPTVQDIERFGTAMTGNVQAGASNVASTDANAALEYLRVDGFQYVRAPEVDPNSNAGSLLNRHVNDNTDRYLPES